MNTLKMILKQRASDKNRVALDEKNIRKNVTKSASFVGLSHHLRVKEMLFSGACENHCAHIKTKLHENSFDDNHAERVLGLTSNDTPVKRETYMSVHAKGS